MFCNLFTIWNVVVFNSFYRSNPDLSASHVPPGWVKKKKKKEISDNCYSSTKAVVDARTIVFYGLFWWTASVLLWAWCFHAGLSYFCVSQGRTVSPPNFFFFFFIIGVPLSALLVFVCSMGKVFNYLLLCF